MKQLGMTQNKIFLLQTSAGAKFACAVGLVCIRVRIPTPRSQLSMWKFVWNETNAPNQSGSHILGQTNTPFMKHGFGLTIGGPLSQAFASANRNCIGLCPIFKLLTAVTGGVGWLKRRSGRFIWHGNLFKMTPCLGKSP